MKIIDVITSRLLLIFPEISFRKIYNPTGGGSVGECFWAHSSLMSVCMMRICSLYMCSRYMSSFHNSLCWRCVSRDHQPKVISMSLYGSGKRYTIGAIRNAQLLPVIYPGWRLWIYCEMPASNTSTKYVDA